QISTTPDDEEKEEVDAEEGNVLIADQGEVDATQDTAAPVPPAPQKLVPESAPSKVKPVLNPINLPVQKTEGQKSATPAKGSVPPPSQPDNRPRRTQEKQP